MIDVSRMGVKGSTTSPFEKGGGSRVSFDLPFSGDSKLKSLL